MTRHKKADEQSFCIHKNIFPSFLLLNILKYKNIGITSGASAPEKLVFDLIEEIKKNAEVEVKNIKVAEETKELYFCGCKKTTHPPFCDGSHSKP